jgi:hypothetical protein
MADESRYYLPFDSSRGYPTGSSLFYECTLCDGAFPSLPGECVQCSCGNAGIDWDHGRLFETQAGTLRLFKKKQWHRPWWVF